MQAMQCPPPEGSGSAQVRHFGVTIFGSDDQQPAQQEAVRARQGSSRSQTMHQEGRTIRSASRPTTDNALEIRLCTREF
jgi:hypothetical protein